MTPVLLTLALVAAPAAPDDTKPGVGATVGGVGIVSPNAKLVFVPAKDGGIEALDVATGKPLWKNKDANKLAGASDKLVLAWAGAEKPPNNFRVLVFDTATGKTLTRSEPLELPAWAATAKAGGRSFRTAAHVEADKVVVVWQANAFYYGGARPTPEIEEAARKAATGVASIDVKTGKVTTENRKPRPEEFGTFTNNVGDYEFGIEEVLPGFNPGAARFTKVTLTVGKDKKELWKRELAGNPWSPPPP